MNRGLFSWEARIPVVPGDRFFLHDDINALRSHIRRLVPLCEYCVRENEDQVLAEGRASGICYPRARGIGAAMEAFAGRHAVRRFVFRTTCDGTTTEHILGVERTQSPSSRGDRLPRLASVLRESLREAVEGQEYDFALPDTSMPSQAGARERRIESRWSGRSLADALGLGPGTIPV